MAGRVIDFPKILELPIFPLPNLVFFPRTVTPLHVFEPRYKQMVADVLGDQKQIGLVLLQPGWEADYYGAAEVFKTGSMGLIAEHSQLKEGKYDILLRGQSRFQIVDFTCQKPYRIARVRLVEDVVPNEQEVKELAVELASLFQEVSAVVVPPDWGLDVVEKLDFASLVTPVVRGGSNDKSNLQVICGPCNQRKGMQTDEEFRSRYSRFVPKRRLTAPLRRISQDEFSAATRRTSQSDTMREFRKTRFISKRDKVSGACFGLGIVLFFVILFVLSSIGIEGYPALLPPAVLGAAAGIGIWLRAQITGVMIED